MNILIGSKPRLITQSFRNHFSGKFAGKPHRVNFSSLLPYLHSFGGFEISLLTIEIKFAYLNGKLFFMSCLNT